MSLYLFVCQFLQEMCGFFLILRLGFVQSKNWGVTYSRPTTGTGMPLQERFGARPIWACLVACPVHEITSFVVDSSRSRNSVLNYFLCYIRIFLDIPDATMIHG